MYGLAAIEQANGWAMAGAGASIVLFGLAVLSFLISMIPRLTGLSEKKAPPPVETPPAPPEPVTPVPETMADDINAEAAVYMALTEGLGHAFSLVDLHKKSRAAGLAHPHLSINRFREAGILVGEGEDAFSWKPVSD